MIILAGPVGSGKSEQGQRLAKKLGCPWVSMGELLRARTVGTQRELMKKGNLVDDKYVLSLLEAHLNTLGARHRELVLDGIPRTVNQAKWLLAKIEAKEIMLTAIIQFKISQSEIMKRLMARGREDDRPEVIQRRLEEYRNNTQKALEYLAARGVKIDEIDGEGIPEDVEKSIQQVLKAKNAG